MPSAVKWSMAEALKAPCELDLAIDKGTATARCPHFEIKLEVLLAVDIEPTHNCSNFVL